MIQFGELKTADLGNGKEFILTAPLWFRLNEIEKIVVPQGFVTDYASVPRAFWSLIPPHGTYTRAAVIHDYLYAGEFLPRKKCDDIFLYAMDTLGVPAWKGCVMYCAVRAFGFGTHTARSVAQVRALAGYYTGDLMCVDPLTVKRPLYSNDMKVII